MYEADFIVPRCTVILGLGFLIWGLAVFVGGWRGRFVRTEDRKQTVIWGLGMAAAGAVGLVAMGFMYFYENDPTERALAQASFEESVARTASSRRTFLQAAEAFLHVPARGEVRTVQFEAHRRQPVDQQKQLVGSWRGRLRWEERRRPDAPWMERGCSPVVPEVSSHGEWAVHGTRWC